MLSPLHMRPTRPPHPVADMTSERVVQANRRNAQGSTGPRTVEGRARSGQNARTHGLTAKDSALYDKAEVERLTALIADGFSADPLILGAARAVAETQIHLRRVQAFKNAVIQDGVPAAESQTNENSLDGAASWADLLTRLVRLDRYERRAFTRRQTAIRRFNNFRRRAMSLL